MDINKIFKAIADPTRREIFHVLVLASAALSITQIADKFEITRQGVTKHINLLRDAGLVNIEPQGRERFCIANLVPLKEVKDWLSFYDKFWHNNLINLDKYLDDKASKS